MASSALIMDSPYHCPYIGCGEPLHDEAAGADCSCAHCGAVIANCGACRAANRLLATYCRGCGVRLGTEAWPCHPGLQTAAYPVAINSIRKTQGPFPVRLGAQAIASPIAASGLLVVSLTNGSIDLLSEFTGKRSGRLSVPEGIIVTPAMRAGFLFVAAGPKVYCFDLARYLDRSSNGYENPVWAFESTSGSPVRPVLVDEQAVYVASQKEKLTTLQALSQRDGRTVWSQPPQFESGPATAPLLVNDRIVVISLSGEVFLVNAASGAVEQSFPMRREVEPQVAPFVERNRIILADKRYRVFEIVLDQRGGASINDLYAMRARATSLAATEDFIVVGHMAGMTLLDGRGRERWSADDINPVSVTPIVAGETIFALDDAGYGLLFNALKSNPVDKVRLFAGSVGPPPLLTQASIAAVSSDGEVVAIRWQ